jgi:hypothetical protein
MNNEENILYSVPLDIRENKTSSNFPGIDRLFFWYERHWMKMSTEHVRNNTDRVELKYRDKNHLQCHISFTTYTRRKFLKPNPSLRDQNSATTRLSQ